MNEIDFGLVRHYCSLGKLPNLAQLLETGHFYRTESETAYDLLEPWIQWVTVHTGIDYAEHGVFRLGDIVERDDLSQLWEELEDAGKSVGAISPFNAANRLSKPAFFAPDPWTQTHASGSWLLQRLSKTISLAVNENASSRVGLLDAATLVASILTYSRISQYPQYLSLLLKIRDPGVKAMLLDQLLGHVFTALCKKENPDFASLFLNSGAHIQHHYLFNSSGYSGSNKNPDWYCDFAMDPLEGILTLYDKLIGDLVKTGHKLIIATGLHQVPHEVTTYYWRLKKHADTLSAMGINNSKAIIPRMSRDFLIEFHSAEEAADAAQLLLSSRFSGHDDAVFSVDNRGDSLFVEFIYSHNVTESDSLLVNDGNSTVERILEHLAFVAIKNGEHNGEGYVLSNVDLQKNDVFPLRELKDVIVKSVA